MISLVGKILTLLAFTFGSQAFGGICKTCPAKKFGDIVHRSSALDGFFVGHSGLYNGSDKYYHVAPGYDDAEAALQRTGAITFLRENDSWGAKRPQVRSSGLSSSEASKMETIIRQFMEYGVIYDADHRQQTGKYFSQPSGKVVVWKPGYFQFDCVGFTEGIYGNKKSLSINVTPDKYETGIGWPLTVREQRDSTLLKDVK